ncbi:MAG: single-stranded DNA-binding protein [Bacilli bacterium]|nr:single-stranded DNA-binding protein [Bacilli bacterium]MBQ8218626.1 single-stranded DNA-binding protein [Bacilli bacterium]
MNKIILDGCVQKDVKLFEEIANFNISAITGKYTCLDNTTKNRFTYIRVVYPSEIDERLEEILQPGVMVRVYGKIDSEQYVTSSNKVVYNKIICAEKIVRIRFNEDIQDYVEVL